MLGYVKKNTIAHPTIFGLWQHGLAYNPNISVHDSASRSHLLSQNMS